MLCILLYLLDGVPQRQAPGVVVFVDVVTSKYNVLIVDVHLLEK